MKNLKKIIIVVVFVFCILVSQSTNCAKRGDYTTQGGGLIIKDELED